MFASPLSPSQTSSVRTSDDDVNVATAVESNGPSSLVGKKLEVQWESGRWYSGEIKAFDEHRGTFTLCTKMVSVLSGIHVKGGQPRKNLVLLVSWLMI